MTVQPHPREALIRQREANRVADLFAQWQQLETRDRRAAYELARDDFLERYEVEWNKCTRHAARSVS